MQACLLPATMWMAIIFAGNVGRHPTYLPAAGKTLKVH
jgi:hypothetical protein